MLLLLVLMVRVPVSAAGASERASGLATPGTGTVQATPTEDATVTALNKEKLAQEVQQLRNQNETDLFGWLRTNAAILLSTLVVVIGGLIGLWRWVGDRRSERKKRDEDRFQAVTAGLGSDNIATKIGAAIMLRTFLQPGYERFYRQAFDLAVAYLRPPNAPEPLDSLSQALTATFIQAFPLARDWIKQGSPLSPLQRVKARLKRTLRREEEFDSQSLDASRIQLGKAFLWKADLEQVFMPGAFLQAADLTGAHLREAKLWGGSEYRADLRKVKLRGADLSGADLGSADLSDGADLSDATLTNAKLWATLTNAKLWGADLTRAKLCGPSGWPADLSYAKLVEAKLCGADLSKVKLCGADLSRADLRGVKMNNETDLRGTTLQGAKYNTETIQEKDAQGKPVSLEATQWPQGFNPSDESFGLILVN